MDEAVKYLRAIAYLLARSLPVDDGPKAEVILARAGLPHEEIARALGKSRAAVAKAASRAQLSTRRTRDEDGA